MTIATALPEAPIHELRAGVRGEWLRPGDDGYDPARRVWNATVDFGDGSPVTMLSGITPVAPISLDHRYVDRGEVEKCLAYVRGVYLLAVTYQLSTLSPLSTQNWLMADSC